MTTAKDWDFHQKRVIIKQHQNINEQNLAELKQNEHNPYQINLNPQPLKHQKAIKSYNFTNQLKPIKQKSKQNPKKP